MNDDNRLSALKDDVLWGVGEIAEELHCSVSKARDLMRKKVIPYKKFGPKTIMSSRKELRRAMTVD